MHLQIDGISQTIELSATAPETLILSRADTVELAIALSLSLAGKKYSDVVKPIEDSRPTDIDVELEAG